MLASPRLAKGKPDAAFEAYGQGAVVRTNRLPAEVFLEFVDSGIFRYGFVLEEPSPVVAFYPHLLEPQHFLPVQPAIGAPDQGAEIVFLVSETGARVMEPGGFSTGEVGVPDQGLAILRGGSKNELAGFAGRKQPLGIARRDRLLLREGVVEPLEFLQPAFGIRDELQVKPILRFSAPDLVSAILAEFLHNRVFRDGQIGHHREERGRSRIGDRSLSLAIQDDIHAAIPGRLLVVPHLAVDGPAALDADHQALAISWSAVRQGSLPL